MKTRNGFVSNSSSSSFVVGFRKVPTCSHDVLEAMFPTDAEMEKGVPDPYGDCSVDAITAATLVWNQIRDKKPLTKSQIREAVGSGWFEGHPDLNYNDKAWEISREYHQKTGKNIHDKDADPEWKKKYETVREAEWKAYHDLIESAAKELFERVYPEKFKGKKVFQIWFSDNDGDVFTTLEHSDTFRNLPHTVQSHH